MEAWNAAEDLQPGSRVATDLDLGLDRTERVEGLLEQIAHNPRLGRIPGGADVVDRQIVVHAHVALDETRHIPLLVRAVEPLEDEDVAAAGRAAVGLPVALPIRMRQCDADGVAQSRGVSCFGRTDAVRETSFFHAAPCRTA